MEDSIFAYDHQREEALPELDIPAELLRRDLPLPNPSELEVLRHYTRLSQKNFSIDTQFYPLGSCTMKYNPRIAHELATLPGFSRLHPATPAAAAQGLLQTLAELQDWLAELTGMAAVSLSPAAGAQGELAGVAMIRAYHRARGDSARQRMLIPGAAHGTNPASARMAGFTVTELPNRADGDLDLNALAAALGPDVAGIMLTNPSTLGVFERQIEEVAALVHQAGALLYYDGANLNAILGRVKPGTMGFDVMHLNLHKTFATPHGGGGPGSGAVAVGERLVPYLPVPRVTGTLGAYRWESLADRPESIGQLSAHGGNIAVLLRAHAYIRRLGRVELRRVATYAALNANYLQQGLRRLGYQLAYPERRASHEFIVSVQDLQKASGIRALDVAKRLLDFGIHAPTVYFPQLVPECLLIEPTETESKATLDRFLEVMAQIRREALEEPDLLRNAPQNLPVQRVDETLAARRLQVAE
ncbi:aminomethyl-transferring glycine dehydrogenase subunit GcvPB [Candidatus Igneacidithiobacillus taiwanensis]|uniref:aminomethyl-transferring glycine dehydrogenase subunit GcvPB n=1 Tax=Candidatus Igneacidithiobacillus taiwanensis TaxID=1945924 RepID=UPI0028985423|nr:aminomethyl-transferring glycine dehydrogenase subunit GcvPB [Candidatus Igneacidithiobacillus taiwanensis]MCE5359525.1 aminomethyl-transferring glycine dehydrogenase subunit GcvPB [Acidithiobacillus sp.]